MKKHHPILYTICIILLVLQIISFIVMLSYVSNIRSEQQEIRKDFLSYTEDMKQDTQFKINELAREIAQQQQNLSVALSQQQNSIASLQAGQEDFSAIINDAIKGVVSVGTDKAAGTGFIITTDGYVITNEHVVNNAQYIKALGHDGALYDAQLIGYDSVRDVALIKINGNFAPLELADSDSVQIGEKVIAIGNPLGLSFSVTSGIVSGLDRQGPNGLNEYIQTDVTLNPGNSGGPLLDIDGKVIGINNFKISNAEGLGFALKSDSIKMVINSFNQTVIP